MRAFLSSFLLPLSVLAALVGCSSTPGLGVSTAGAPDGAVADAASLPDAVAVDAGNSPSQGPTDAKVTVIEFGDFECPYCGAEEPVVTQMLSDYAGRIRFVFKEFPLSSIHPYAELAAEAALAANAQGQFWPYHNTLYANQTELAQGNLETYAMMLGLDITTFDTALDSHAYASAVAADEAYGMSVGVTGTPTFFINGIPVVGAVPYSDLQTIINRELAAAP